MQQGEKFIIKICLTGGPCAGKTTSLSKLRELFTPQFAVYTVPELATMTFSSGVTIIPSSFTEEDSRNFNAAIIQAQIDMEKYFENLAMTQRKRTIIITDRGCCDNFAYTSEANKAKMLSDQGWTMNFLCNERYDMVIHLVTAASGADEFYILENNAARSESKDEAIALDLKIQKQWVGHPNFVLIDNSQKGFERKINRVLERVGDLAGTAPCHRIVKKYLLHPSFSLANLPNDVDYNQYSEVQTFLLTSKPKTRNFVIKRTYKDHFYPTFIYCSRRIEERYEKRIETHRIISEKFYLECISSQRDRRYDQTHKDIVAFSAHVNGEHNLYSIEKTSSRGQTYMILKVTRDTEHGDVPFIPAWLQVADDITECPKFFSFNYSNLDYDEVDTRTQRISAEFRIENFKELVEGAAASQNGVHKDEPKE